MQDENQADQAAAQQLDHEFSKPWEQSDVILVVEGQQFHVHRVILSMSSPVFSRMFSSDFKEKGADEIPLPEKKADEIREMLLVIYPSYCKRVDETNCYILLPLAREYQMKVLTEKCEDHLLKVIEKAEEIGPLLENLMIAQNYTLERMKSVCVDKTQKLSIDEVRGHELYERIEPLSQRKMIELQMSSMQKELREMKAENVKLQSKIQQMENLASAGLTEFNSIVSHISNHIRQAKNSPSWGFSPTTDQHLALIYNDTHTSNRQLQVSQRSVCCAFQYAIYNSLQNLQTNLKTIKGST